MTSTPSAPPEPGRTRRSWTSRTSLITIAAIAGVLIAGTAAVAANIGILNAADSSQIGELTATDDLTAPSPTSSKVQQYDIESAGSVWVAAARNRLALDHVETLDGWAPAASQVDVRSVRVDFTSGARTIVFTASLAPDGTIDVDVTEPTAVGAADRDDDHRDDDHDDDNDHDDHDDHDHDGADDDD